jgi:hypothetical protein
MASNGPLRLTLELERATEPLSGAVVDPAGRRKAFSGWMQLAAVLAEASDDQPIDQPKEASNVSQ